MNPHIVWCIKSACPASGHIGKGTITIHSQKEHRYRCSMCGKTFGARHGTPFYRRRTDEHIITQVITLIAWGCPLVAVEHAFGFHPQTIRSGSTLLVAMPKPSITTWLPSRVTSDTSRPTRFG